MTSDCLIVATSLMQNSLPLTPGNPLRNITGLARQIALPGEHAPLRFPSFPALERTAVMGFNQPATLPLPASTSTKVAVSRQATYPVWADHSLSYFYGVDYAFYPVVTTTSFPAHDLEVRDCILSWTVSNRAAAVNAPGVAGVAAFSTWPIFGKDSSGVEYLYIPAGSYVNVVVCGNSVTTQAQPFTLAYELWSSPGENGLTGTVIGTIPNNQSGVMVNVPFVVNCWMRPTQLSLGASATGTSNPVSWTVSIFATSYDSAVYTPSSGAGNIPGGLVTFSGQTADRAFMPLVLPVEFSNSSLPWYATRTTSSALLGTNVTQVLNKSGTVLAGRVSPSVQNMFTVSSTYVNGLHPAEKAFLPLETGVYTYCPPSTDLVFFADYTVNTSGGAASAPLYRLDNDALYNVIFLTPGGAEESLAVTSTWHLEFRTSSALFQIGLSAMTLESLHQAQLVLSESGYFFENPKHDGLLNKVINAAKKFAPDVVGVANPVAGKVLRLALRGHGKTVVPKPGPSKPPSTSAQSSGMNTRRQDKKKKPASQKKRNRK